MAGTKKRRSVEHMKCENCEHSLIEIDNVGGDEHIVIYCEHKEFILPRRAVDGLGIYLRGLSKEWIPDICPEGG